MLRGAKWAGRGLTGLAAGTWLGIHSVGNQSPAPHFTYLIYAALAAGLLLMLITRSFDRSWWWFQKPKLEELLPLGHFVRSADGSKQPFDLHVIYARIRNKRDGGGEPRTLHDARAQMTVLDEQGRQVGPGCEGNWLNISAGTPNPFPFNRATFAPDGTVFGLEIAAKFSWQDDAWLAGEVNARLAPGTYRVQALISDGVHKATKVEWEVTIPQGDGQLSAAGLDPGPPERITAYYVTSASGTTSAAIPTSGTAIPIPATPSSRAGFPPFSDQRFRVMADITSAPAVDKWEGLDTPANAPDLALVRRAIDRASAQLRKQRSLIYEWRTHDLLDPDERGEWETEDRKGILHQDGRYRRAYEATEDAFNAISLMRDRTNFHRAEALQKIDVALTELAAAHPDNPQKATS